MAGHRHRHPPRPARRRQRRHLRRRQRRYTALRTPWARSEAWADLAPRVPPAPAVAARLMAWLRLFAARIRHGRPAVLALRIAAAAVLTAITAGSGAGTAPEAGTVTGIVIWLALTARADLAPPPGR